MRCTLYSLLWLISLASISTPLAIPPKADPTPAPAPAPSPFHFPDVPQPPTPNPPTPAPGPVAVDKLGPHQTYVLWSDADGIVTASPSTGVTITKHVGPLQIHSIFSDGTGKYETRTYDQKFVFVVHAAKSGTVELLGIPTGATSEAKIDRRTIQVDDGTGPQPPPPGPGPKPSPIVDSPSKLFLLIVEDTAAATAARGAMFNDGPLSARVKAKGHTWRVVDKDVVGTDGKPPADVADYLKLSAGKKLPQLFLVDPSGVVRFSGDLPGTTAELLALIQKFGG